MKRTKTAYRKLPGKGRRFFGWDLLWLGTNHLLLITANTFSENYKRFYFGDIQAFTIRKTAEGWIFNLVCGLLLLLCTGGAFGLDAELTPVFGSIAVVFLLLLVGNAILGPTCVCHIQTAVQTEKLTSLRRLRRARKTIDRIMPHITQAQGSLALDPLLQSQPHRTAPVESTAQPPSVLGGTKTHTTLYLLLLILGLFMWSEFYWSSLPLAILENVTYLGTGICVVAALVHQGRKPLPTSLKTFTWVTLGLLILQYVAGQILGMVVLFKNQLMGQSQWELFKAMVAVSPHDSPVLFYFSLFSLLTTVGLGLSGLALLLRLPRNRPTPPPIVKATQEATIIRRNSDG